MDPSILTNLNFELYVLYNGILKLKDSYNSLNDLQLDLIKYRNAFLSFSTILDIALTLPILTARVESCFSVLTQVF